MKLTKSLCNKLRPKDKPYKKFDGGGLYLEVMPNGNKFWRLKYYFQGKEKRFSLGRYPVITLVKAREKRIEAKRLLDSGIDPSRDRIANEKLARRANRNTFEIVAREWSMPLSNKDLPHPYVQWR
ncbi:MAG: Arm DNA-binding domain-containing protein [Bacteroidota bacterium]